MTATVLAATYILYTFIVHLPISYADGRPAGKLRPERPALCGPGLDEDAACIDSAIHVAREHTYVNNKEISINLGIMKEKK